MKVMIAITVGGDGKGEHSVQIGSTHTAEELSELMEQNVELATTGRAYMILHEVSLAVSKAMLMFERFEKEAHEESGNQGKSPGKGDDGE